MNKGFRVWLLLGISITCASSAIADLSVETKSWPKQLPPSEHGKYNYYGNGQAESFHKAIQGGTPITEAEKTTIDTMMPESETDRYYLKMGIHKSTCKLGNIKNVSPNAPLQNGELYAKKLSKDVTGFNLGAGYIFPEARVEVEYITGTAMEYNQTPLFVAGTSDLQSKITGHHVVVNGYYEFKDIYLFKPFVGVSVGIGMNKVSSTLISRGGLAPGDGIAKSKSSFGFDYGLQVGARLRVLKTKFYTSASYRYLSLGTIKWADNSDAMNLKGKRTLNGFCLDLIYLL